MRGLRDSRLIHLKGWAFLVILICAGGLLLFQFSDWQSWLLLALVVWSSARFYYYLFYVIENYVDPDFRFSGVLAAIRFMVVGRESGGHDGHGDRRD